MVATSKSRGLPRWKVIYDQLHAELASCAYGSEFHTISAVCRKFNVSPITAIRALNELASRGLIDKIPGRGNVVRRVSRPLFIRLVTPNRAPGAYMLLDSPIRRRFQGIAQAAERMGVDFDTISEGHLGNLFPRQDETFGFLVPHGIAHTTLGFFRDHQLPFVFLDPFDSGLGTPHARVDRVEAGYLAARHLLDFGHRRIAWITGLITRRNFRDRIIGYRRALHEANVPFRWSLIKESEGMDPSRDEAMLLELMSLPRPPSAVIAGDDNRAIRILNACRRHGIHVPGQLSVLGYPNYPESRLADPPLSVVDPQYERVGETAVKMLLSRMANGAVSTEASVLISPELVQRGSTGPVSKISHGGADTKRRRGPVIDPRIQDDRHDKKEPEYATSGTR